MTKLNFVRKRFVADDYAEDVTRRVTSSQASENSNRRRHSCVFFFFRVVKIGCASNDAEGYRHFC